MSHERREGLEGFPRQDGSPLKSPSASRLSEGDSAALADLARRLARLQAVEAPARLRGRGLARALATPPRRAGLVVLTWDRLAADWPMVAFRIAASLAAAVMLGYGTVAVSSASPPSSPLYPVRLLVEDIRVAVAPVDQKPQIYAEQALHRVEQTEALIQSGRLSEAERAMEDAARRIVSARSAAAQSAPRARANDGLGSTYQRARAAADRLADLGGSPPARLVEAAPPNEPLAVPGPAASGSAPQSDALRAPEAASPRFGAPQSAEGFAPISPAIRGAGQGQAGSPPARTFSAPGAAEPAPNGRTSGFTPIETGPARAAGESAAPAGMTAPVGAFGPIPAASGGATTAPTAAAPTATATAVPPTGQRQAPSVQAPEGISLPLGPSSASASSSVMASQQ